MARLESLAPASAGERRKIRIGEFDRFPKSRQTNTLGLQKNESKAGIVEDDDLHRQLVVHRRQELAHQHVETAITTKGDDLARTIEHLDAVGLAERSSDGAIVEGSQDPLRTTLPNPIAGPQRVDACIDEEYRIAFGGIADCPRHRLRVDAIAAAFRVGLLVEHRVPLVAVARHALKKLAIGLCFYCFEQQLQSRSHRSNDAERGRGSTSERTSS